MKFKFFSRWCRSKLVRGSLVMFAGTMAANIGNYFYHLLMGRLLGPEDYGALQSVISVAYLLFILLSALTLTTAKFVAVLKGKKNFSGVRWLFEYFNQKLGFYTGAIFLLIGLLSPLIAKFLHLNSFWPIIFIGLLFLVSSLTTVYRAILQGLLKFGKITQSHIAETSSKVAAGVFLVWLGWRVNGAVLALVLAAMVGYFLARFFVKARLQTYEPKKPAINKKMFLKFGLPVFLFNLSFTSLYTNDVILVKHFFSAHQAGLYASLAVLGKIGFFATSAIPMVMFPMIAQRHSQKKDSQKLLLISLAIVLSVSSLVVAAYYFLPKLMVRLLFGESYLAVAPLLVWMAVFMAFYSLSFLLVNYFLSVDKIRVVFLAIAAAACQAILIIFSHQSLIGVIKISIAICLFLFISLMLYYVYDRKKAAFRYRPGL